MWSQRKKPSQPLSSALTARSTSAWTSPKAPNGGRLIAWRTPRTVRAIMRPSHESHHGHTRAADGGGMKRVWIYVGLLLLTAVLVVGCSDSKPPVQAAGSSSGASAAPSTATTTPDPDYAPGRHELSFTVGDATRTAVLVVPSDLSRPAPLVFAFHGHGGSGANLDRKIDIDGLWPDAIVIYPDG